MTKKRSLEILGVKTEIYFLKKVIRKFGRRKLFSSLKLGARSPPMAIRSVGPTVKPTGGTDIEQSFHCKTLLVCTWFIHRC